MRAEYTRELGHNYLLVRPQAEEGSGYALKILEAQTVPGTLPMEVRQVNGEMLLYYRVDGLQSLEHFCLVKRLRRAELQSLCGALCAVSEQLKELLLDEENLFFSPETIFYDRAADRWLFVCDPFGNGTPWPESFADVLTSSADPGDEEASAEAFRLSTLLTEQAMPLSALTHPAEPPQRKKTSCSSPAWKEDAKPKGITCRTGKGEALSNEGSCALWDEKSSQWEQEFPVWGDTSAPDRRERAGQETKEEPVVNSKVVTLLCAIVALACIYLRREYVLTAAGNVLTIAAIAIAIAGFAGSLFLKGSPVSLLKRMRFRSAGKKKKNHRKAAKKRGKKRGTAQKRRPRQDVTTVEALFAQTGGYDDRAYEADALSEHCDAAADARLVPGKVYRYPAMQSAGTRMAAVSASYGAPAAEAYTTGEAEAEYTRLLQPDAANVRGTMLYSRSAACNKQIGLERLPFTVGKGSPSDVTLPEESVSRTHAWLNRDASGDVTLRDLNSTNGTFRNGIRLKPGEEISLRRGDEIRFGNLVFEYL